MSRYNAPVRSGRSSAATNDPRDRPAYPLVEAARYLKLPPATLRAWTLGRRYPTTRGKGDFQPLIRPASGRPPLLSFSNLIEAHVLRALLYQTRTYDMLAFVAVPIVLCVVAGAAILVPARTGMKVEPTVALRYE